MKLYKLATVAAMAGALALPSVSLAAPGDLLGGVTGLVTGTVNSTTGLVTGTVGSVGTAVSNVTSGGLVNANVSGNSINANPATCANVLSSGSCAATATQNVTNTVTGGAGGGAGSGLVNVNVSGNSVNLNPATCLNLLSSGACAATATQNVTNTVTSGNPGQGGGMVTQIATAVTKASKAAVAPTATGALPRTGAEAFLIYLLSFGGSMAAGVGAFVKQRLHNQSLNV